MEDSRNSGAWPAPLAPTTAAEQVSAFLRRVYGWMCAGLGITALVAYEVASSPTILSHLVSDQFLFFGLMLVELGLVFYLSARAARLAPGTATALFVAYAALNGVTLSFVFLAYTGQSVATAFVAAFDAGAKLAVVDGYGEVPEGIVDALRNLLRVAAGRSDVKMLVLAQETTPAYCRFYGEAERRAGSVVERHLRGLDLEGCRTLLGNPAIPDEDLRRIFLLTKGCPLYLQYIREGDEYGLRANSRFTNAEIRLLLYSGRAGL